jgi:hypothetical protein
MGHSPGKSLRRSCRLQTRSPPPTALETPEERAARIVAQPKILMPGQPMVFRAAGTASSDAPDPPSLPPSVTNSQPMDEANRIAALRPAVSAAVLPTTGESGPTIIRSDTPLPLREAARSAAAQPPSPEVRERETKGAPLNASPLNTVMLNQPPHRSGKMSLLPGRSGNLWPWRHRSSPRPFNRSYRSLSPCRKRFDLLRQTRRVPAPMCVRTLSPSCWSWQKCALLR